MDFDYIIVQAGGKGTRMEYLTVNKPKCLVPVENLPMLFHLFKKYPDKKFIIIGDYKYEVLREYLRAFTKVKYLLIDARGKHGTCAGISSALKMLPEGEAFMLIWSDLILQDNFFVPDEVANYIGISGDFSCRWKYEDNKFIEEVSTSHGVAGLFVFQSKAELDGVVEEGEFVRWLKEQEKSFTSLMLSKTREYGLLSEYKKIKGSRCRPFNRITLDGKYLIKEGIDEQGKKLAIREKAWYNHVQKLGIKDIPKIVSFEPFRMEKIEGKNVFEYSLSLTEKEDILKKIIKMLRELHEKETVKADYFSMKEAYVSKTFARLDSIRNLIPFADNKYITVNGRKCRNVFFCQAELEDKLNKLPVDKFQLLHGDCTFSNMMLRNGKEPVMIDPRGYFGYTELYGDVAYDWAKLYYSIVGNYDQFNIGKFHLEIEESEVKLSIDSNGWEDMQDSFFTLLDGEVSEWQIKLIHAIIWLSLATYAWSDYDSVCGAFYNGIYYLEDAIEEIS